MLESENNFTFGNSSEKNHTQKCFPRPHEHFWGIKQSLWSFKKSKRTDITDHHTIKRGGNNDLFFNPHVKQRRKYLTENKTL